MEQSVRFWDKIADRYSKRPVANEAVYQEKLRLTRQYFNPDTQVLEFGCGTGSTAISHAPFVAQVRATDISTRMIEIARAKAEAAGVRNVTFVQETLSETPIAAASLDVVLGLSVLHLMDDWRDAIDRTYKLLKPGGVFVSSTMCLADDMKFLKLVAPVGNWLGLMPAISFFTLRELETSLKDAGFVIERQWQPGRNTGHFIIAAKDAGGPTPAV